MPYFAKSLEYLATGRGEATSSRIDRTLTALLWLHLPVAVVLALYFEKSSWMFAVAASVLLALTPTLLTWQVPGTLASRMAIGLAGSAFAALLVHLSGGLIEYHFQFFVLLAVLSSYRDYRVLVASSLFIAAHHLLFNYFLPYSLFNYGPSLKMVILHALFVVLETTYLTVDILMRSAEFDFVETVRNVSGNINRASREMSGVSERISQHAQDQAASVEEIAASMTEIGQQTELNTENVREAATVMSRVRAEIDNGSREMRRLADSMEAVEQDSKHMAQILRLIDDIAFQTNLLALNAAVEAARAGDSGKGFAVVAAEVRNLASRSAEASRNIGGLVENTLGKIDTSAESSSKASSLFKNVLDGILECERRLQDVLSSSEQQSKGTLQVGGGLSQIELISQKSSTQAMEGADIAAALSQQAETLKAMLDGFTHATQQGNGSGAARVRLPATASAD